MTITKIQRINNELLDEIEKIDELPERIWGIAKAPNIELGQIRIISGVGLYYDVKEDNDVKTRLSRKLAYLLRHTSVVDSQGFCPVTYAMDYCGVTEEELRYIVDHDSKNRFEMIGNSVAEARVRARNGHSGKVKIDPGLKIASPPWTLYHATTENAIDDILTKKEGLKGMARQYIQLTECPETALEAAKRHKKHSPVLLEINAHTAFCCGIHFYLTTNGIWQAEHIPYYYIRIADNLSKQ